MKYYQCKNKNCNEHQSCIDVNKSREISQKHIKGKFCKNSNQCSHCCYLKSSLRIVNHFFQFHKCSRKCEICCSINQGHYEKDSITLKRTFLPWALETLLEEIGMEDYHIGKRYK